MQGAVVGGVGGYLGCLGVVGVEVWGEVPSRGKPEQEEGEPVEEERAGGPANREEEEGLARLQRRRKGG
jgi:hypothetical protein